MNQRGGERTLVGPIAKAPLTAKSPTRPHTHTHKHTLRVLCFICAHLPFLPRASQPQSTVPPFLSPCSPSSPSSYLHQPPPPSTSSTLSSSSASRTALICSITSSPRQRGRGRGGRGCGCDGGCGGGASAAPAPAAFLAGPSAAPPRSRQSALPFPQLRPHAPRG